MSSPQPISSSPHDAAGSNNSRRGSMAGSPFRQASLRLGSPVGSFRSTSGIAPNINSSGLATVSGPHSGSNSGSNSGVSSGLTSGHNSGPNSGPSGGPNNGLITNGHVRNHPGISTDASALDFDDNVFTTDRRSLSMHRNSGTGSRAGLSRAILSGGSGVSPSSGLSTLHPPTDSSAVSISEEASSVIDIDNPDPEIVKVVGRHLVRESRRGSRRESDMGSDSGYSASGGEGSSTAGGGSHSQGHSFTNGSNNNAADIDNDDKFSSLRLQGGDITRQLYNWQREHEEGEAAMKRGRSRSFDLPRPVVLGPNDEPIDTKNIKAPGGFRRNFITRRSRGEMFDSESQQQNRQPAFLTRNFIEFLSIYGHFAGEELEDDEDEEGDSEEGSAGEDEFGIGGGATGGAGRGDGGDEEGDDERRPPNERTALIGRPKLSRKKSIKSSHHGPGNASATKAVMLLLKSFVGTGVLFLPKAYSNGGILFSSVLLVFVSIVSYWCFLLLIASKDHVGGGSFGDIGGTLYGPRMRQLILSSIVLSQIGFAAAYIVFVSENLQAFVLAVTNNQTYIRIEAFIFLQLIAFLPLSMIRDIAKLSGTALIADFFILLGLVYLYYYGAQTIYHEGIADVVLFNSKSWTLFIGTAIFTYEGIGLIIPIQESMKQPEKFTPVLAGVMVGITFVFVSMGALQYSAYGSAVKTVIILNLPQDSHFVNGVQLLYSIAILLSTPLQLFPAIRIMENWLFVRSGKFNTRIKWEKNTFRFCLTIVTAIIAWGGADDLDKFVALIGSFACIPLVYIYPPLLHMKAVNQNFFMLATDIFLVVGGSIAMVYTTYGTIASWIGS